MPSGTWETYFKSQIPGTWETYFKSQTDLGDLFQVPDRNSKRLQESVPSED